MLSSTDAELVRRSEVMDRVLEHIKADRVIKVGLPEFAGAVGEFRYDFEGEDDLLHISVSRTDQERICVEDAQDVVHFLLPQVAWGVIWLKPGTQSHHFYVGHDELL
jgi:hypothetical protein